MNHPIETNYVPEASGHYVAGSKKKINTTFADKLNEKTAVST